MKTNVKEKAIGIIEELPDDEVEKLLNYLLWLKDKEEWEATMEIIANSETMESIARGKRELDDGKLIPWLKIRER